MYSTVGAGLGVSGTVGVLVTWCFHSIPLNREGVKIVARAAFLGMSIGTVSLVTAGAVRALIHKSINPKEEKFGTTAKNATDWAVRSAVGTILTMAVAPPLVAKVFLARRGVSITYTEPFMTCLLAPALGWAAMVYVDKHTSAQD